MIELQNLTVAYGRRTILENLDCVFPSAKLTVLLGPNGCGKSTLLKAAAGLAEVKCGTVRINGQEKLSPTERAQRLAYLPQSRNVPQITARRMVLHGRFPYLGYPRRYRAEDFRIADEALAAVGMANEADCELTELSGGQRQKVYLAMLLAQQTDCVLLDEPTTYLDVACQLDTWALCEQMRDSGKTVVAVTHEISQALRYADRLLLMQSGRIAAQGTPEEILDQGVLEDVFSVSVTRFDHTNVSIEKKEENP